LAPVVVTGDHDTAHRGPGGEVALDLIGHRAALALAGNDDQRLRLASLRACALTRGTPRGLDLMQGVVDVDKEDLRSGMSPPHRHPKQESGDQRAQTRPHGSSWSARRKPSSVAAGIDG